MFLKKVYRHSRWFFILFVAFITGQLFINYKHGMVASPFLHYGMYSEVMKVKHTYGVFEVMVNGKPLQGKDYSAQQWDKIILPLRYYANIKAVSNKLYYTDIKRLMAAVKLSPVEQRYVQQCNAQQFQQWYKRYVQDVINTPVKQLDIRYHIYHSNDHQLQPTDTLLTITDLCS
jgi:hypothetical protein